MRTIALITKEPRTYDSKSLLKAISEIGYTPKSLDYSEDSVRETFIAFAPQALIVRHTPEYLNKVIGLVEFAEQQGVAVSATSKSIRLANDKAKVARIMFEHNIEMPRTITLDKIDRYFDKVALNFSGMAVLKPTNGSLGRGVHLVNVLDVNWPSKLSKGVQYIAQEYIEEAHGQDVRIFVVDGKVVAGMERKSTGSLQSNIHSGGSAYITKISPEEESLALRSAEILGARVVGVDILRSRRGPLLLELNTSPGLRGIEKLTGCDIAGNIVQALVDPD